jgi:4-hydroxyphenylpyruvate dioxygenase
VAKVESALQQQADFLPIQDWDHVEFYVGNAKQAAYYYRNIFGMTPVAYAGLETGVRDRASYVLQSGNIRLVFTCGLTPDSPVTQWAAKHGDGVRDIALRVDDARAAFAATTSRGARPVMEPTEFKDEHGVVVKASIATYGDVIHTFVERKNYRGVWAPGYQAWKPGGRQVEPVGVVAIDHIVGNVELGKMNEWVKWYEDVMGFTNMLTFDDKTIHTEYSSLMSKVMAGGHGKVKFPINEPAEGKRKSQIQEYLDWNVGPGAQHIAMLTGDIVKTVSALRENGLEFLSVPDNYYDTLKERVPELTEDIETLRQLRILVDHDDEGYLLQLFSKPVEDRPTLFIEIIQRKGAKGFGAGNFKALFEAIEREQALRGNL